jgi:dTDP-4-amino-4,6-dideoxygalactose transaminase
MLKKNSEILISPVNDSGPINSVFFLNLKPILLDSKINSYNSNLDQIKKKITKKTKAIIPVHFTGYMTDMRKLMKISKEYRIPIIEDACQSILGSINNKKAGTWGITGAFSLHPLKNINVWSDGGIITTNNKNIFNKLKLLRNHGLKDRDHVHLLGYNSRLDTFQSVVGSWLLPSAKNIANQRIKNANYYDKNLSKINEIKIPIRPKNFKIVYHLYIVFAKKRDQLLKYCLKKGIEAKVHYPVPMYLQKALKNLKHKRGDFPVTDRHCKEIITFPCDQHLQKKQLDYIIKTVKEFYKKK